MLAERFFGFELGQRQWTGIGLVAVSLALLTVTGARGGEAHSGYSLAGMIQRGVLLGIAAGLGFGISDVVIKPLSGDLDSGPSGVLSPWTVIILTAAVLSFFASARSRVPPEPTPESQQPAEVLCPGGRRRA